MNPLSNKDFMNKAYLDEKLFKKYGHLSSLKKHYNEFKLHNKKQSVKTTVQFLYNWGLFDRFLNAEKYLKGFFVCYKT